MTNLVEFLRARLDEDEQIARAASGSTVIGEPGNWRPSPRGDEWEAYAGEIEEELLVALRPGLPRPPDVMSGYWGAWVSNDPTHDPAAGSAMPALTHAGRHDPARILADVAAKRELVDAYAALAVRSDAGEPLGQFERGTLTGLYRACWVLAKAAGWEP